MAKDVVITPASGTVVFSDTGNEEGRIYSQSGNLYLDATGNIIFGDGTPANIDIGDASVAVDFTFLGGGNLSSSGNVLNIGKSGDTVNLNVSGVTYNYPSTLITTADYTANDVLTKIKTVDGVGSGLDADLLDGLSSSSANAISTIVARDASGNFSAGTITASLSGNASTATALAAARTITLGGVLSGSVSIDGSSNVTLTAAHTSDPVITLTGAVTGSGTMTNLGSVSIATTATADPTLTLAGDATGSATFTNLGNASLTVAIVDDSHSHSFNNLINKTGGTGDYTTTGIFTAATFNATSTTNGGFQGIDADTALLPSFTWTSDQNTGIWHAAADQIGFTTAGVNRLTLSTTALTSTLGITAPTFTGALSGNASTATAWATGRTLSLTGDVTGTSAAFTGSGNITIAATIAPNSVALGTDTTGNYVSGIAPGQGITVTGTAGEGWTPTVSLTALDLTLFPTSNFKKSVRVATTANITLSGVQTIDGIAVVAGDRVLVKNQTTASQNGIYVVAAGTWTRSTAADGSTEIDSAIVGVEVGTLYGGEFFTNVFKSTDVIGTTAMPWYKVFDESDATNANTASRLVQRDSSGNFSAGTITAALSGNATTATTLQNSRTIGGVSFNGSANINLPGVNTTGNQNTTGSAATLTTARTINGVSFNGSADITVADATKLPLAGGTLIGHLYLSNYNIYDVNNLTFSDPGPSEGISWTGGNMKIYESPDDLTTNTAGNLQFVYGTTRRLTVNNTGINVNGTAVADTFNATSTTGGGFQGIDADTAAIPSFTWTGDQNTGMWHAAADQIGFTTAGVNRLTLSTTALTSTLGITAPTATIGGFLLEDSSDRTGLLEINRLGTTAWTGIQAKFSTTGLWSVMGNETQFGLYDDAQNEWILQYTENAGVSLYYNAGVKIATTNTGATTTGTHVADTFNATSVTDGGFQGIDADTALIPSFTWTSDLNTGIWHAAADQIGFTTGGTNRLTLSTNALTSTVAINAPSFDGALTGNATTATTLATARTISLGGDATGSVSFNGSANVTLTVAVVDDSHNHIIANVDGLQTALDSKGAVNGIFYENNQTVTTSYTITSGKNAMTAGPVTINSGVTVTIGSGQSWTVV